MTNVVVPAIQSLSEWFASLPEPMQNIITGALLLTATLSPMFFIMSKIVGVVPSLIKMFNSLRSASLSTYLGIASLAAALGLVFDLIGNWSEMSALEKVLKIPGVKIRRESFLTNTFSELVTPAILEEILKEGPYIAGVKIEVLDNIAKSRIKRNTLSSTSASFLAAPFSLSVVE